MGKKIKKQDTMPSLTIQGKRQIIAGVIKFREKSKGKMFVNVVTEAKAAE